MKFHNRHHTTEGDNISINTEDDFSNYLKEQNQESVLKLLLVKSNDIKLEDEKPIWIVINGSTLHHFIGKII